MSLFPVYPIDALLCNDTDISTILYRLATLTRKFIKDNDRSNKGAMLMESKELWRNPKMYRKRCRWIKSRCMHNWFQLSQRSERGLRIARFWVTSNTILTNIYFKIMRSCNSYMILLYFILLINLIPLSSASNLFFFLKLLYFNLLLLIILLYCLHC